MKYNEIDLRFCSVMAVLNALLEFVSVGDGWLLLGVVDELGLFFFVGNVTNFYVNTLFALSLFFFYCDYKDTLFFYYKAYNDVFDITCDNYIKFIV